MYSGWSLVVIYHCTLLCPINTLVSSSLNVHIYTTMPVILLSVPSSTEFISDTQIPKNIKIKKSKKSMKLRSRLTLDRNDSDLSNYSYRSCQSSTSCLKIKDVCLDSWVSNKTLHAKVQASEDKIHAKVHEIENKIQAEIREKFAFLLTS